ncbi:MAG: GSCFA domain-containing protein, partial [Phycisphaerales bacterium]|nr:GSCFA domain-containing protein [Phycisphaerales bacterium]
MSLLSGNAFGRPRSSLFSPRRFRDPTLGIQACPTFRITNDDRVLCMGSCFARAVGRMLRESGIASTFAGQTHRYNAFTILQALRWATTETFEPRHLVVLDDGRVYDPHDRTEVHEGYATLDEAYESGRVAIETLRTELARADVFVMTLGLVEVWYDRATGTALNHMPPRRAIASFDDRFEIRATTHDANREAIRDIFALLRAARPEIRILCSVSPIPLRATWCHDDVFVA